MYAIVSHGGRQHRVSAGDRLVVDRMDAEVGSIVALAPVLLTGGDGPATVGDGVEGVRVAVSVVRHLRGEKLLVFKYKPKKRARRLMGHRSDLTELRVESILAKGDRLPRRPAATAEAEADADAEAATSTKGGAPKPAAKRASASTAKPAAKRAAATKPAAKRSTVAKAATKRPSAAKPATKRATKPKEKRDGA